MKTKKMLSKSQYIKGLQCPKALWLYRNKKELAQAPDEMTQAVFELGHMVGNYAKELYPAGIEEASEYFEIEKAAKNTNDYVDAGHKTIYEACAISPHGVYSKIDVFQKVRGSSSWDLIEVKSSTSVKDYHIDDMAIQRYAFESAGYKIRRSYLLHIDNQYVRDGDVDVNALFALIDCTEDVIERIEEVKEVLPKLLKIIDKKTQPKVEIGKHCSTPFECEYRDHCWKHVPDYSVYNVAGGKTLENLLKQKILDVAHIPDNHGITSTKAIDIDAYKKNKVNVNKEELVDWIGQLVYPLYYLDHETIGLSCPVPLFDNSSPYQQIPFQFSLHIQKVAGGKTEHVEFIYEGEGTRGSILSKRLPRPAAKRVQWFHTMLVLKRELIKGSQVHTPVMQRVFWG